VINNISFAKKSKAVKKPQMCSQNISVKLSGYTQGY